MLRRLILLAALTAAAVPAAAVDLDFNLVAGLDLGGSFDLGEADLDSDTGYSLGLEVMFDIPVIEVGGGVEYSAGRGPEDEDGDLSWYTVYAMGRLSILGPVYLAARYGWSDASLDDVVDVDAGDGTTWSVGAGVGFLGKLKAEVLFNQVSVDIDGGDLDYESWTLRLLYTF